MPELCLIKREIWGEDVCHIQTVTQEVGFGDKRDTVARICLGSDTGSVLNLICLNVVHGANG